MIYRPPYGSTCLNAGCVPSKFLIHRARIAHITRTAARYHVDASVSRVRLCDIVREMGAMIDEHRSVALDAARNARDLTLIEDPEGRQEVLRLQRDLFVVGADLATNPDKRDRLVPGESLVTSEIYLKHCAAAALRVRRPARW